jgi:hypothetical protein
MQLRELEASFHAHFIDMKLHICQKDIKKVVIFNNGKLYYMLCRYYYMFKLVSLAFSLLMFFLTSYWTSLEILNLFISVTVSLYCIWCIWSLRE